MGLIFAMLIAMLFYASPAQAEGSKELASQGGDRGYLMYRTGTTAGGSLGGIPLRSDTKVWAQAGERIWLGSSALGVGSGAINYTRPDGTTGSCSTTGTVGRITTRAQEVAGPSATGGFTPCAVTVGTGQGGVWDIEFVSPSSTTRTNPTPLAATDAWSAQTATDNWVTAWDITVRNTANTANINGRAFADYLSLNLGANSRSYTPQFYVQTRDGYRFRYDLNGIDPLGFVFFANNKGFKDSSGNSLYRSVQLTTAGDAFQNGETVKDPSSADTTTEVTHKVFINTPSSDLPASAASTDGTTWLVASPAAPPTISNLSFTGSDGTSNQAAPGQGGTFRFTASAAGPYRIALDTNRDGTLGNGTDRILFGAATAGQNAVAWDGKDGNGDNVAVGSSGVQASVASLAGEVHFPIIDAENNPSGNILERLISPPTDYTVYYNDSSSALTSTGTPPSPLDARTGTSSASGAHAYSGAYGDHKGIDTWAYGASSTTPLASSIQVRSADLEVVTNTDNQTNAAAGNQITYTVTVRNNGPSTATGASFADTVPTGVNNVAWTCQVTTGTGTCGAASGSGNSVATTLNLNSGAVATFTITGTIAANAPATLSNTATVTRPNDTEDTNANNNSSTDTTTVNRRPTADNESYSTNEDQTLTVAAPGVLDGDADADTGQTLTPEVVTGPSNGTLTLNANGSLVYNPNANYFGTETFTYRVCDSGTPRLCSEPATVTITVAAVNDPPTATNDSRTTDEDTPLTFAAGELTANDSPGPANESGQTLTVTSVGNATNGTVSLQNGQVTFTPAQNFNGAASFTYTISDGNGGTATGTVNVTVRAVNDAPDAVDDARTTDEDTAVTIPVLANDTDPEGNALSVTTLTQPANGTATVNASGVVTYTPNNNFAGTDTFTYMISDGNGGTDMATVTVTVNPVNDGPTNAVPGRQTINEDTQLVFSQANGNRISVADPDSGGQPLSITISVPQNTGTLTLSEVAGLAFQTGDGTADRTMTFTGSLADVNNALRGLRFDPAANFNGEVTLTLATNDQGNTGSGGAKTDTDTVPITVTAVNDQPSLSSIPSQTTNEDTLIGPIGFTFSDVETANADLQISVASSNTSLVPDANIQLTRTGGNGTLQITPAPNQTGSTTITVTVTDANGSATSRSFVLTVTPVNDAPTIDLNGAAAGTGYTGTFTEGGGAVPAASPSDLNTDDIDSTDFRSATVTLTNRPDGNATESLAADVAGSAISANYNAATGVLTLTGPASEAEFQRVLRTVTYNNSSENPSTTARRIEFVVNDGQANSNTAVSTLSVVRTNDPPVAANDSYTTREDQLLSVDPAGLLANDSDVDGDSITVADADAGTPGIQPVSGPQNGTLTLRANGSFVYTPRADFFGTDSFVYRVSDGNGGTATATATITVDPVNDPPVAENDTRNIAEDEVLNFVASELAQNDSPGPGEGTQTLTVTAVGNATNGTVRLTNGRVVFTPTQNFNGRASFEYTISDGNGGTATGTVAVDVAAVNDPPVADDESVSTDEDTAVTVNVLDGDTPGPANEDGQTLTVTEISGSPSNGTVAINPNNTVTYTPRADFNGTDSFVYRVCDSGSPRGCATGTVTVTVNAVNDPPVAENDVYEINEDETLEVGVADGLLSNDRDIDGGTLSVADANANVPGIQPVRGPQSGTLTLRANGSFTYTPGAQFSGTDTFVYRVSDGRGGTSTATATISTNEINDPPEADDEAFSVAEDGTLEVAAPGVLDGDTDGDNDPLTVDDANAGVPGVQPVSGPQNGTLTLRANGSFVYTPRADFFGTDSFVYRVSDGRGGTDTATVTITVDPVNDPPVAGDDTRTTAEDQILIFSAAELTQNDSPGPNEGTQTLTVTRVFDAQNGTVRLTNGRVVFTPAQNFNGPAQFSYEVCDSGNPQACDTATTEVTVTPVNDPPNAVDDAVTTDEDTAIDIDVRGNDSAGPANENGQTLTVTEITVGPQNGSVAINNGNDVTYTPRADFNGTDSFVYRVCDSGDPSRCADATVRVTVEAANDGPVNTVPRGVQRTGEERPVVFSGANGNRISVSDPDAGDADVTVELSVPDDAGTLTLGGAAGVTVDGDGTSTVTVTGPVDRINAALDGLTFGPLANFNGPAVLTVATNDGGNTGSGGPLSDEDTVNIAVEAVNDAPTIDAIADQSTNEDTATRAIGFGIGDVETPAGQLTVTARSSNTTLVPNGNIVLGGNGASRTVTVTPAANRSGSTTITLTVRDADGVETTESFLLTVVPVNDAPVNDVPGAQETNEDTPLVFAPENGNGISLSDPDADDGDVTVALSVPQGTGTLTVGASSGVEVSGSNTNSVTLTGTVADIVAALDGLRFDPAPNTNGAVTLTISTDDGGNTGSGGALTDEDTVEILVLAANDAPTFDLPESPGQSVDEDGGTQTVAGFVTNISPGPNEDQGVRFRVTNNNENLFTNGGQPAISPDGTLTYTPAPDANGIATVTVVAIDDGGTPNDPGDDVEGEPRFFTITVEPVNDPPTISAIDDRTIAEDGSAGPINFDVGDVETAAGALALSATSSNPDLVPAGNVTFGGSGVNRTVSVTPLANRSGTVTITVRVRDNEGREATEAFTVTVEPVNDAPTAENDTREADEDTPLVFPAAALLANDSAGPEEGDQILSVTAVGNAQNGTVALRNGQITFTPADNFNGRASFDYTISDGAGGTATATVFVAVAGVNDAPTIDLNGGGAGTGYSGSFTEDGGPVPAAGPDALETADVDSDRLGSATVTLTNRPDGAAEMLAASTNGTGITSAYDPDTGVLTLTGPAPVAQFRQVLRTVTYMNTSQNPTAGERQIDFVVRDDGDRASNRAVSTITVAAVNDAPGITLPGGALIYNEGDPATVVDAAATVADPDSPNFGGGRLTVDLTAGVTAADRLGILEQNGISLQGNTVSFNGTVIGNYAGGEGPDPLVVTFNEDATRAAVRAVLRSIAFGVDSDNPSEQPRTIRFVVTDGDGGQSEAATKRINVTGANDAPVVDLNGPAAGLNVTRTFTEDGGPVVVGNAGALSVSDADDENIEGATVRLVNRPDGNATETLAVDVSGTNITADYDRASGVLTLSGSASKAAYRDVLRTVTYNNTSQNPTPTPTRRVEFVVNDGDLDSGTAVGNVTVVRLPDPPVAADDTARAAEDGAPVLVNVLANDEDPENDTLTITGVTQPPAGEGTVEIASGGVRFTPSADFNGRTAFTYTISDGNGGTSTANVTVTVAPTNDDPTARNDELNVPEDSPFVRIDVLGNDSDDPDTNETLTVTRVGQASDGGTVEIVDGGAAVRYKPARNFTGTETFRYTVSDGNGGTAAATVTITVGGENDAPEVGNVGDSVTYTENEPPVLVAPGATVEDPDSADFAGGELTVALTDNAQPNGRLAVRNVGDGEGEIGVSGDTVSFGGTPIGTVSGGTGPDAPLTVSLNENATPAAVQALLRNVVYRNVSENPVERVRTITFTLTDGDGGTGTARKSLRVIAVNDPPVVELARPADSVDEGGAVTFEFAVTDPDSETFTIAAGFPSCGAGGELVDNSLSTNPTGGSFRCRFPDGPADPTVSIRVEDPQGAQSNTASRAITVTNVAPRADIDGPYAATEDTVLEVPAGNGVLAGDTDAGGDELEAVLVRGPGAGEGRLTLERDGSFVFTPADGFNGRASFVYRACEVGSDVCSDEIQVNISVAAVNDAPTARNDSATVREDATVRIDVVNNDTDPDGRDDLNPASVRVLSGPQNGRATVNGDGSVTYEPRADFNGADSFVYEVCDRAGECARATVNVTVEPVNDAPTARDDAVSTSEDEPLRIPQADLLDNDAAGPLNENGQTLRITSVGGARNGTVRLADNGDIIFTPDPGYNGPASFVYTVTDGQGNTDQATANVDVDVSAVNDEPVGQPDGATTNEDEPVTIDVLGNDTDPENDTLAVAADSLTQPENGTVEIVDGGIRYTPRADFNGTDTFTYRADDGQGGTSAPVRVTVTVNPINDVPVGNPDSYATDEDAPITRDAPGVLANDDDADGGQGLTVRLVDDVQNGTLDLNEDGSFTYTPNENFNGRDSFTYVVVDGNGAESEPVTVSLAVAVGNDAPQAEDDEATVDEDRSVRINALANDTDPDNDALSISAVAAPANGTAVIRNGEILYTPNANFFGTDTFEYTIADADGATSTATVTVTVRPVNDAPIARDDTVSTVEDTPLRITQAELLGNDAAGPPNENGTLRVTAVGNARNGTVRLADNGDIIFTPAVNYNGPASFVYTVTDSQGNTDQATANVNVTVDPVNDAPEAINDRFDTGEDEPITMDVLANDTDPEGELDPGSVTVVTAPQNGQASVNADGTITYNPRANFNGTDTLVYRVCDSGDPAECDTATVEISVGAANDAPTANDDTATTEEDTPVTVDVLANDEDPEGREELDASSVQVTTNPANGTTSVRDDGSITYRPNANFGGTDSFVYRVCDTGEPQQCASAEVQITVNPANDDPTATTDEAQAEEGGPAIFMDVLANDSAAPDAGETLSVSRVTQPPNGQGTVEIVPAGEPNAGKLRFTPGADFSGRTTFTYTVSDGNGGTATATVTVTVAPTNDPPTTADDEIEAQEGGQPVRVDVLANDSGAPDAGETLSIVDFSQPPSGQGTVALASGQFVYTPDADFSGETQFTYTVDDGNGGRSTATVRVTVVPDNDPPLARPDTKSVAEDGTLSLSFAELTANDSAGDPDQALTITSVGNAQNGTVRIQNGRVVFTPARDFFGDASFTYTACDDGQPQRCDTTTVNVSVTPVNDPPIAAEDAANTREDEPVVIDVTRGDRPGPANESGQSLTVTEVTAPAHGTAEIIPDGQANAGRIRYTPDPNFNGTDTFVYTVCDDEEPELCDTATVTVTVGAVDDAIEVVDDRATTREEQPVTIRVLDNDSDLEGLDPASVSIETQPANGRVRVLDSGAIVYTPAGNFSGTDSFQYEVCDLSNPAQCATATVRVRVTDVNDAPVALADKATTAANTAVTVRVLANDEDPEGRLDRGSVTVTRNPSNGRVAAGANGTLVYTPRAGFSGTDTFVYRVCDAGDPTECDFATVTVVVRPPAPAPPRADIVVNASAPTRVTVGQRFRYTMVVTNRGPDTSRNVVLRGTIPGPVSVISVSRGCDYSPGQRKLVCNLGDMAKGGRRTYKVTVRAERAGETSIRANVSSDTPDPIKDNNTDSGG